VCLWSLCIQSLTFSKAVEEMSDAKLWQCSSLGLVNTSVLQPSEFLSFDSSNPSTPQSREVDRNLQVISLCGLYTLQSGDKGHLLCLRTLSGYQIFQTFTTPYLPTMSLYNARAHTHSHLSEFAFFFSLIISNAFLKMFPHSETCRNIDGTGRVMQGDVT